MARDLEGHGAAAVYDALYGVDTLDLDALRDSVSEYVHSAAESVCTYYHTCYEIVNDYENHPAVPSESEIGGSYRADQRREAMSVWAFEIAEAVIYSEAHESIEEIEEAADVLCAALNDEGRGVEPEGLRLSRECPHGWAAHDREDNDGIHYWTSGQVDGLNALAIKAGPVWLSYTWEPVRSSKPSHP